MKRRPLGKFGMALSENVLQPDGQPKAVGDRTISPPARTDSFPLV